MKPYAKAQTIVLGEKLDRRCKLTDADRTRIRELYAKGNISHLSLARLFKVSKSLIGMIVNPARAQAVHDYTKAHWRQWNDKRGKEGHAQAVRNTRRYKYDLYKKGVIGQEKQGETKCT